MPGILETRSEAFSVRVVKMKQHLQNVHHEYEMSKQVVRSGTSIGANIAEAFSAESKADFIHKLQISLKEANETAHWIRVLHKTSYLTAIEYESMLSDCNELIRLLVHSIKKVKSSGPSTK